MGKQKEGKKELEDKRFKKKADKLTNKQTIQRALTSIKKDNGFASEQYILISYQCMTHSVNLFSTYKGKLKLV